MKQVAGGVFKKKESMETRRAALDCMTRLASVESAYSAITRSILEYNLLGTLFSIGLTSELMKTMTVLQKNLSPHIKTMVEEHVLEEISEILVGIPFHGTNGENDKSGDDKRSPRNHGRLRSKSSHRQMKFVRIVVRVLFIVRVHHNNHSTTTTGTQDKSKLFVQGTSTWNQSQGSGTRTS